MFEQLKLYIRVRYTLIYVRTGEENRILTLDAIDLKTGQQYYCRQEIARLK